MSMTTMPQTGSKGSLQLDLFQMASLTDVQSKRSNQTTSKASSKRISSPASEDGQLPCASPDGQTIDLFGPEAAPASLSASPESKLDSRIPVTYGPTSKDSSTSDVLQSCLESRLRARLNGSELCEVTWRPWNTPWGQCRLKPRARVRTTSEIGFGLWPTATTSSGGSNNDSAAVLQRGHGINLIGAAKAALWGTARVTTDGGRGTPGAKEKSRLEDQVQVTRASIGSSEPMENRAALNPEFVCWLMGYKAEWLFAAPLNVPTSRTKKRTPTAGSAH